MLDKFAKENRKPYTDIEIEAIKEIVTSIHAEKPNKNRVEQIKREIAKKYKLNQYPRNSDILKNTPEEIYQEIVPYLRIRNVRSMSGVNVI